MRNTLLLFTTFAGFNNTILVWLFTPIHDVHEMDLLNADLFGALTPFMILSLLFLIRSGFLFFYRLHRGENTQTYFSLLIASVIMLIQFSYMVIDGNPMPLLFAVAAVLLSGFLHLLYRYVKNNIESVQYFMQGIY